MESKRTQVEPDTVEIVQGDVYLVRRTVPEGAGKIPKRPLAYGEATGNSHQIVEDDYDMYEHNGIIYVRTHKTVTLRHSGPQDDKEDKKHGDATVDPADWMVGIVREFDLFEEEERRILD